MMIRGMIKLLKRTFPDAVMDVSKPFTPDGVWMLNVRRGDDGGDTDVIIQWRGDDSRWGLSKMTEANYNDFTHKPDEVFADWREAFIHATKLLATDKEHPLLIAYIALADRQLRMDRRWHILRSVDPVMIRLNAQLLDELVIRGNRNLLISKHDPMKQQIIDIEVGPGWYKMVGDMIDKMAAEMHAMEFRDLRLRITTIKEKFAGLRVYYNVRNKSFTGTNDFEAYLDGEEDSTAAFHALHGHVAVAETISRNICQDCGKSGRIRGNPGEWIQTLCDTHSQLKKRTESGIATKSMFDPAARHEYIEAMRLKNDAEALRVRGDGGQEDGPSGSKDSPDAGEGTKA